MNKQEQMYCDMVRMFADVAEEGFGIDVIHNPLFSGTFRQQLERHHYKLVNFINKYAPVEPVLSPVQPVRQEHTQPEVAPAPLEKVETKQSSLILTKTLGE